MNYVDSVSQSVIAPAGWERWKLSHAFKKIGSGTTPESGNPDYYEDGTIPWLNTGDLNDGVLRCSSKKITPKALKDYSSLKLYPKGSLAIAMYGATIGKTSILDFETTTNQACCVFQDSEIIDVKFLYYWFIAQREQIINLAVGGGQPNISQDILRAIRLYCPARSEQKLIIAFLDDKTSQVDRLISKKEKLIELLQEERTAIINQAVTKGLDPNVPMKDSGIEWLGEIPKHWYSSFFKQLALRIEVGIAEAATHAYVEQNGVPILRSTNIKNGRIEGEILQINQSFANKNASKTLFAKDLVTVRTGNAGLTAVVPDELNGCQCFTMLVTTLRDDCNPHFYNYLLNSNWGINYFEKCAWGTAQKNISVPILGYLPVVKVPRVEQDKIVAFLDNEVFKVKEIEKKIQREIDLLQEYKEALISEAVTGKIDVRQESLIES